MGSRMVWAAGRYGDVLQAWPVIFDSERANRCDYLAFERATQAVGCGHATKQLWNLLIPEPGRPYAVDNLWPR